MQQPKALSIGGAMLLVLAMVPGFPTATFLGLAFVFAIPAGLAALAKRRGKKPSKAAPLDTLKDPKQQAMEKTGFSISSDSIYSPTTQLLVEVATNLEEHFADIDLREEINKTRLQIYFRLGVSLPPVDVRRSANLPNNHYRIFVQEIPSASGEVIPNSVLAFEDTQNLDLYQIPYEQKPDMVPRMRTLWVEKKHQDVLDEKKLRYKTEVEAIAYHAEFIFAKYASQFIGIQDVKQMMNRMEVDSPDLVKEAQRVLQLQPMADLFRRLVQEFVCVRDLRTIFSAMVDWAGREKDPVVLTEHLRIALARQISHQYANQKNVVSGILLDGEIEETVRGAIRQTSTGNFLQLDPQISKGIIAKISAAALPVLANGGPCCLITSMDVRRYVRRMCESELPELPVLSYQELSADITLSPVARVSLGG